MDSDKTVYAKWIENIDDADLGRAKIDNQKGIILVREDMTVSEFTQFMHNNNYSVEFNDGISSNNSICFSPIDNPSTPTCSPFFVNSKELLNGSS